MPKYFFHICEPDGVAIDEEGTVCVEQSDVLREAECSARDLIKQCVDARRRPMDVSIEVHDEQGTIVTLLPLREVLENPRAPRFRS